MALFCLCLGTVHKPAAAQGTVQTSILGVPPILPSPTIEDVIRDYERGLYPIQVAYTHPSRQAATFRFRFSVELDGDLLFETTSEPVLIRPGIHTYRSFADDPDIHFREGFSDLVNRIQRRLRNTVIRTGALPEGTYLVTVEAEPEDPFISSLPGTAQFTVRFAEPPLVVAPLDGVVISQPYPIFSWLPVISPVSAGIEYHVVIVELMSGQSSQEAILGNRPILSTTTTSTVLVYGPENLPLEKGRTYAWQLTAADPVGNLPISDGGRSEIQTFTYDPSGRMPGDIAGLSQIDLVPDFARLTSLDFTASEQPNSFRLNGRAVLELQLDEPIAVAVDVHDLEIQNTDLDRPVLMGGSVQTRLHPGTIPTGLDTDFIEITDLNWQFGQGFTIGALLDVGDDRTVSAKGSLNLTPMGLEGRVGATLREPLVLGDDPVEVRLTRVEATFPAARLHASGDVFFFGEPTACGVDRLNLQMEEIGAVLDCRPDLSLALVDASDRLQVNVDRVNGSFSADMLGGMLDYDLNLVGGIDLAMADGAYCGANGSFRLTPGGFEVDGVTPNCGASTPLRIDLGVIDLALEDLRVTSLSYDPGSGWDFALDLDGDFRIPAIDPSFRWPLSGFELTRNGFILPSVQLTADDLPRASGLNIGGFGLSVDDVRIEPLVFPWFDWSGADVGPWDVSINGEVALPAGAHLPGCLSGQRFALNDFRIHNGGVSGSLPFAGVNDCELEIGPSAAFIINSLGGRIVGDIDGSALSLTAAIDLDARLSVGAPFVCEGDRATSIAQLSFAPGADGTLSGTIENVVPPCPIGIGPFRASISDATLKLDGWNGAQGALLSADAALRLSPSHTVNGSFGLDLTTGSFTALDFALDHPFELGMPAHDPLLTFRIQKAELSLDGFRIDGRQELLLPDQSTIGATFDRLRADIATGVIDEGEIVFDTGFALEAGILGQTLDFGVRPSGSTLSVHPGVLIDLPGSVRLGRSGLAASGTVQAQIDFGEWTTDLDVAAVLSSDFALGLNPAGVARGRVDLEAGGIAFAYIDSDGFHPNPAAVAGLLPDVLPLPSEDIAYLELRRDGRLVVEAISQPDGSLIIETLPGESLDLVVPFIDGAPRFGVSLNDLRVRRSGEGLQFEGGMVQAFASSAIDLSDAGIPISLRSIAYGHAGTTEGATPTLVLTGDLQLFDDVVGNGGEVMLSVSSGGDVAGTIDLDDVDHRIVLGSGGLVGIDLESISGSFLKMQGAEAAYDWTVGGAITINDSDTNVASADVALRHRPGRIDVLQFDAGTDLEAPAIELGNLLLDFDGITELKSLQYNQSDGFSFRLAVDFGLGLRVADPDANDAEHFRIDLKGIDISDTGLHLPAQTVHGGTIPALDDAQVLTVGPIDLRLIGIELINDVHVSWPDFGLFGVGDALHSSTFMASAVPVVAPPLPSPTNLFDALKLSLGIRVNAYPELADYELSVYNAGFSDGLFSGAVEALSFIPGFEPRIAIGESAGLLVSSIGGALTVDADALVPTQGFEFDMDGAFELPTFFEVDQNATCADMDVSLRFASPGRLSGAIDEFAACGSIAFGPASLAFPSSTLIVDVQPGGDQTALLDGDAVATLSGSEGGATAGSNIRLDLLTGRLLDGSLSLTGSFGIGLPADDPLLQMEAQQLTIDRRGFVIDGNGSLQVGTGAAGISFDGFAIDPREWAVVGGSMSVESTFAFDVGLSGSPSWKVTDAGSPVEGDAALRLDVPANVTLDPQGLHVGGSSTAALHYGGETYASLSVDFVSFALGLAPTGVRQGRADFSTGGMRIAYYDANGFHFDAAGIIAAVVPERLPLPTEDVAYLRLKDEDGNVLVGYEEIDGGYTISSNQDGAGNAQPLELVVTALGEVGSHPTVSVTLDNLHVNSTMQQVMSGSIEAMIDEALTQSLDIPLHLQTIRYARNAEGDFALTVDGRIDLPAELGDVTVDFAGLGITSAGFTGEVIAGQAAPASTCSLITPDGLSDAVLASVAYSTGDMVPNATAEQLAGADLGLALHGVRLVFDPQEGNSYSLLGQASSRITSNNSSDETSRLPFLLGYDAGTWRAELCTNILPNDEDGNRKLSLMVADLYLDEDNGGQAALEIGDGEVELVLSGMLTMPEVMGREFRVTVQDLRMGTRGISVASAGAGLSGQETTLFGDVLKLRNDNLGVTWDSDADALALTLSGSMWLTPFMCADGNATSCADQDAVTFSDLRIDTRGNVTLGGGAVNLLAARDEPLAVIGDNPDPTLAIDMLAIRKPSDADALLLDIGGELKLPDVADGVSSTFLFSVSHEGHIETEDPLHMRFVRASNGIADQVDERGDNPATEIDYGGIALLDVKEVGVAFPNGRLLQPAVYANGSIYIQEGVENQVRLGSLGGKTVSTAGLYIDLQSGLSVNAQSEVDEFDLGGFIRLSDLSVATNSHPDRGLQFVLGGNVGVAMEGLAAASADWRDLTIDRQGIADHGRLGQGGLTLSIVEVITLSIGSLDYGSGTFEYYDPATETTEQKTAESYFAMTNASVDLTEAIQGGVDAIYYYRNGNDTALEIYNANVSLAGAVEAALTMRYENEQGNVFVSAMGRAEINNIGAMNVAGQIGSRVVDGQVVSSFGLFASLEVEQGLPIIPGIVSLTTVGGGFFRYPDEAVLAGIRDLGGYDFIPDDRQPRLEGLKFAALLHGGAGVIGAGPQYLMEGSLLLQVTDQHTSIAADVKYLSMDELRAGMYLTASYGTQSGLEGGVALMVDFPHVLEGQASVNFAAYDRPEGIIWMIDGKLGDGGDGPFNVLSGIAQARGDFVASNDGVLLRELSVSLRSPKIYIIEVRADAEISFWYIPDHALGAYGELSVSASLLGGLAEAGADLKGAYLREDELIYMAASAYVRVLFVFEGRIGIWASLEKGRLKGGEGRNARYDQMVADARQQADDLITRANEMAEAMEAARSAPFEYDMEAIRQAGLQLVSASARDRAWYAQSLLCVEQMLFTSNCAPPYSGYLSRLQSLTRSILTGNRPNLSVDIDAGFRSIERSMESLQERAIAVEQYLRELEAQAIEWSESAAAQFAEMQLESPLTTYQSATFTGEGDSRRMVSPPSFHVDTQRDDAQSDMLADLKADTDALDEQYRNAIQSAAHNLGQITDLMSGHVVFEETSWMRRSTTVNHLAESYAEATADVQRVFAARADSLWRNRDWALNRHNTVVSGAYARHHIEALMDALITSYTSDSRYTRADVTACNRYFWIQQLRRLGDPDFGLDQQNQDVSDFCDFVSGHLHDQRYSQFATEFKNAGIALWHDVPREGLEAWSQELGTAARQNRSLMNEVLLPIRDGHLALTRSVDGIYLLQTEMAATVHGMLEEYVAWRRGSQGLVEDATDPVIDQHEGMRQSLLRSLEAPTLTSVTVNRSSSWYKGTAHVTATAHHAEDVAQISYAFRRGSGTNIYSAGDLFSNGRGTQMTLHTFADTEAETNQDWAVYVRARGPLGNSATRSASFDLAVATQGRSDAPDGYVADAMPEDTSPPSRPILGFPDYSRADDSQSNSRWWTNNAGQIVFSALSADAQSDIAGFEYRIGTTQGGSDVRDWTEGVGVPQLDIGEEGVLGNAVRRFTVHGLALEEGVLYYVSVRARNGAGLLSSVSSDSRGIIVDSTPPGAPGEGSPVADLGPAPPTSSTGTTFGTVVESPPAYRGPVTSNTQRIAPSFEVRWSEAQDAESGIKTYEYVTSTSNDPEGLFEELPTPPPGTVYVGPITRSAVGQTKNTSVTISNAPVDYMKDVYVHVRAVNNAGSMSDVLTIGPLQPVDSTPPSRPELSAMVVSNGVRIYVTRPGFDRETSVSGYQYAIARRAANGAIAGWVRPFPTNGSIDFGPFCGSMGTEIQPLPMTAFGTMLPPDEVGCYKDYEDDIAPYHLIPASDFLTSSRTSGSDSWTSQVITGGGPAENTQLYIYVRTINRQGHHSVVQSAVGPIVFDTTIPEVPTITSTTSTGGSLQIDVANVRDPESGIAAIEYRFNGQSSWEQFAGIGGLRKPASSYSRTFQFTSANIPQSVEIRLTNGSGLQRVESHCVRDCTPTVLLPNPPVVGTFGSPGGTLVGPLINTVGSTVGSPIVTPTLPPIRR